jgi:hypothetical protein
MNQALYAHMNNKRKMKKKINHRSIQQLIMTRFMRLRPSSAKQKLLKGEKGPSDHHRC